VLYSQEIAYGSHINIIPITNFEGEKISIPYTDTVTVLFLFNIGYMPHTDILSELSFLIINLNQLDKKVKLAGISKGEKENFKKIKSKYNIQNFQFHM